MMHWATLILGTCPGFVQERPFPCENRQGIAIILSLSGPVFLTAAGANLPRKLDDRKDIGRLLFRGERLSSERGGIATIRAGAGKITVNAHSPYQVPDRWSHGTPEAEEELKALEKFGCAGGARGGSTVVWSPPDDGAVRISTAAVNWTPHKGQLAFTLLDKSGTAIWSARGIDAMLGKLSSPEEAGLKQTLATRQIENPVRIELTIHSEGQEMKNSFWILSKNAEKALDAHLIQADQDETENLLRFVARGEILSEFRVYADAAAEFEKALAIAPDSIAILRVTIAAQRETGNIARSEELRTRLESSGH